MNSSQKYSQIFTDNLPALKYADRKFRYSDFLLFREYQTRLFTWKSIVAPNFIDAFNKSKEFHNLFVNLFPFAIEGFVTEDVILKDLKFNDVKEVYLTHRDYYGFFICMYINWEIFKDMPEINKYYNLPHPYESVFKILLRGGYIFNSEKKFEINNRTYLKYDNKFTLPSLDERFLDFIDLKCTDFPNQEKVDLLWSAYSI